MAKDKIVSNIYVLFSFLQALIFKGSFRIYLMIVHSVHIYEMVPASLQAIGWMLEEDERGKSTQTQALL